MEGMSSRANKFLTVDMYTDVFKREVTGDKSARCNRVNQSFLCQGVTSTVKFLLECEVEVGAPTGILMRLDIFSDDFEQELPKKLLV